MLHVDGNKTVPNEKSLRFDDQRVKYIEFLIEKNVKTKTLSFLKEIFVFVSLCALTNMTAKG